MSIAYPQIRRLLQEHFSDLLRARKDELELAGPWSSEKRVRFEAILNQTIESIDAGVPLASWYGEDDRGALEGILQKSSIDIQPNTNEYRTLEREYRHAYRDALSDLLAYEKKLRQYDFATERSHAERSTSTATRGDGLTLAELAANFSAEKKLSKSWVAKTELEKKDHLALLNEVLGENTDILTINYISTKRVKDILSRYPRNRTKNPLTRGKRLEDALNLPGVEAIKVPTINKYLQTYSDMFEWAYKNGLVEKNHFSGITIRVRKERKEGRAAFSREQMRTILSVLTDEASPLINKPYRKWGPLIGAYTGARLNEIAQLHLADIVEREGISCFDINDEAEGKQLKTAAATRSVPLHPKLIELGFLDYVLSLKAKGQHRLFPDFSYSANNGWGRTLGRFFNEVLLPAINIKSGDLVFHSLRHTVVTELSRKGVEQTFVKALVGHQQIGVTQKVYFKAGYSIRQLYEELSKLEYHLQ